MTSPATPRRRHVVFTFRTTAAGFSQGHGGRVDVERRVERIFVVVDDGAQIREYELATVSEVALLHAFWRHIKPHDVVIGGVDVEAHWSFLIQRTLLAGAAHSGVESQLRVDHDFVAASACSAPTNLDCMADARAIYIDFVGATGASLPERVQRYLRETGM